MARPKPYSAPRDFQIREAGQLRGGHSPYGASYKDLLVLTIGGLVEWLAALVAVRLHTSLVALHAQHARVFVDTPTVHPAVIGADVPVKDVGEVDAPLHHPVDPTRAAKRGRARYMCKG
jgi:hypothetical protein